MKKIAKLTVILLMLACVLSLASCGKYSEVYEGLNGYWTLPEGEAELIIKFETAGKKNKIIIMDDTLDVPSLPQSTILMRTPASSLHQATRSI